MAADTVYSNGRIYTVNEAQPWAEAVAIKDGKFLVVGSNTETEAVTGDATEVVDLNDQFVMPGIVDMHAHPFTGVDLGSGVLNLNQPDDKEAILQDIKTLFILAITNVLFNILLNFPRISSIISRSLGKL